MIRCRQARSIIADAVREVATEADRLSLEGHLEGCAECRAERARLTLLARLRDVETPTLDQDAHARILRTLVSRPVAKPSPVLETLRIPRIQWLALAAALVLFAGASLFLGLPRLSADAKQTFPVTVAEGTQLVMERAGTLSFGGAEVSYRAGTTVVVSSASRTLALVDGEVDVDVTPGGPGHFRVKTPRFTVDVLGTRFVVGANSVRTLRGVVQILDLQEKPLAMVRAGETWTLPEPIAAEFLLPPAPSAAAPVRARPPPAARHAAPAPLPPREDPSELLATARAQLVGGRLDDARATLSLLDGMPLARAQQAERELLGADALRLSGDRDEALDAYRRVSAKWSGLAAGENGTFFVGELLVESGRTEDARRALVDYRDRYPRGRFGEEVRAHLESLDPARP